MCIHITHERAHTHTHTFFKKLTEWYLHPLTVSSEFKRNSFEKTLGVFAKRAVTPTLEMAFQLDLVFWVKQSLCYYRSPCLSPHHELGRTALQHSPPGPTPHVGWASLLQQVMHSGHNGGRGQCGENLIMQTRARQLAALRAPHYELAKWNMKALSCLIWWLKGVQPPWWQGFQLVAKRVWL